MKNPGVSPIDNQELTLISRVPFLFYDGPMKRLITPYKCILEDLPKGVFSAEKS